MSIYNIRSPFENDGERYDTEYKQTTVLEYMSCLSPDCKTAADRQQLALAINIVRSLTLVKYQ
jgi:hypothetical protein